jgi:hypothetical protein
MGGFYHPLKMIRNISFMKKKILRKISNKFLKKDFNSQQKSKTVTLLGVMQGLWRIR